MSQYRNSTNFSHGITGSWNLICFPLSGKLDFRCHTTVGKFFTWKRCFHTLELSVWIKSMVRDYLLSPFSFFQFDSLQNGPVLSLARTEILRAFCELCSKLTIQMLQRCCRSSNVFIFSFQHTVLIKCF